MPEEDLIGPATLNGNAPDDEPFNIEDVIREAELPTRTVRICVKGDLRVRYEDLHAELEAKSAEVQGRGDESLAGAGDLRGLAEQVKDAAVEMHKHMRKFVFRAISGNWASITKKHQDEQGGIKDSAAWSAELVAAAAVSPPMTAEQARRLFQKLSQGDVDLLFMTARKANFDNSAEVPKSRLASEILEGRRSETS